MCADELELRTSRRLCAGLSDEVEIIFSGDMTVPQQGWGFWAHVPELEG